MEKEKTMKRQLALALLLSLTASAAYGLSAAFTAPKAGETWDTTTVRTVSWTWSGSAIVKLVLYSQKDAKQWVVQSNLKLNAGAYTWNVGSLENGKATPSGIDFQLRLVKMADNTIVAASPSFDITAPMTPASPAPVVMSPNLKVAKPFPNLVVMSPNLKLAHVAGMTPPPDSASFAIKQVTYDFESQGKLRYVDVLVSVSSPAAFDVSPGYGDPNYGAQWVAYEIENPVYQAATSSVWIADTFSGTFSVKGGGGSQPFGRYPKEPIPAGAREYILSFKPVTSGPVKGCGTFMKMPSGLCRHEYYPRMKVDLFVRTANKTLKGSRTLYLLYDTNVWPLYWIALPGETNLCANGVVNW
jgi:hypothetical protein